MFSIFKDKSIGLLVVGILILVVVLGFFYYLGKLAPEKLEKQEQALIQEREEALIQEQELYAIAGNVVKVDVENKELIIAPEKEKEVKVKLDEKTEIFKLTVEKPPAVEEIPVIMADIKVGDHILAESNQNIFGKTEIADVWKIRILP